MRVLILSCNTGEGHNAASAAIREELIRQGVECEIKDALCFISRGVSDVISWGHVYMYRHLPRLFRYGYQLAEKHRSAFGSGSTVYQFFAKGTQRLYAFCDAGGFDIILCPHAFAALMITDVKRRFPLQAKTFFLATDYTCSPSVEKSDLDGYFIPEAVLKDEFIRAGIPEEKLIPSGIPIRSMFYHRTEKITAKRHFAVPEGHRHMVLMCGSMGCGPMRRLSAALANGLKANQHLTVVCGTNKKLYKDLQEYFKHNKNIRILGFVNNMSELLDSADLYITKPGGISVTEAAAKKVPMVLVDAVAGCEKYNMYFFAERGCALFGKSVRELKRQCLRLISDEAALWQMTEAYRKLERKNGSKKIFETFRSAMEDLNDR